MKNNVVETTNMIGPKMYINHHWINQVGFFLCGCYFKDGSQGRSRFSRKDR